MKGHVPEAVSVKWPCSSRLPGAYENMGEEAALCGQAKNSHIIQVIFTGYEYHPSLPRVESSAR